MLLTDYTIIPQCVPFHLIILVPYHSKHSSHTETYPVPIIRHSHNNILKKIGDRVFLNCLSAQIKISYTKKKNYKNSRKLLFDSPSFYNTYMLINQCVFAVRLHKWHQILLVLFFTIRLLVYLLDLFFTHTFSRAALCLGSTQ